MNYSRTLLQGAVLAVTCTLAFASTLSAAEDESSKKPAKPAAKDVAKTPGKAKTKAGEKPASSPVKAEDKAEVKKSADTDGKKEDATDSAKPDAPETHKVKVDAFELNVEIDATFESAKATEIAISPEAWSDLTVVENVAHGALVKKGDVLVKLETEKLEKQIQELEQARPAAELALQLAEEAFATQEKNTPMLLKAARDAKTRAEQDLIYYEKVTRPQRIDSAKYNVKSAEFNVEYNQEELDQLRKMYAADDLTEETEEIIVKRAEYSVESARRSLDSTRERSKRTLSTTLPRELEDERTRIAQARIDWENAERTLPENLRKARLDLEAQRRGLVKSAENLEDLRKDLAAMTITAPHDGIVYYGATVRGKWITTANIEKKLRPSGKLMANEVIITLVQRAPLQVRAAVAENQLAHLEVGQKATVTPTSNPDGKLTAELKELSYVPLAGNTFDAVFAMPKQEMENIFPGMTGKLKIELYKNDKAITVPKAAVKKDGDKEHVVLADGKKRPVKTGKSNDKMTEILSGLKEGEEIKAK